MKSILLLMVVLVQSLLIPAQNIKGLWFSETKTDKGFFKVFIQLSKCQGAYQCFYKTNIFDDEMLKADSVSFKNGRLYIGNKQEGLFRGTYVNDSLIKGVIWSTKIYPARLVRVAKAPDLSKPQTPLPPFPYISMMVSYPNAKAGIRLTGILTTPADTIKKYPAVVLLSGSEKDDKNYSYGGHQPFAVLADYFTKRGIAVLRFNDRGVNGSTGKFETTTLNDLAGDARAAIDFLAAQKSIDTSKIGLIGHSEGGMVAELLAAGDNRVKFIISLAVPALPFKKIMYDQVHDMVANVKTTADVKDKVTGFYTRALNLYYAGDDTAVFHKKYMALIAQSLPANIGRMKVLDNYYAKLASNRMRFLKRYDPGITLQQLQVPVLGLFCEKDLLMNGPVNKKVFDEHANKKIAHTKSLLLAGLNHNFQHCKLCDLEESLFLDETFSLDALQQINNWLKTVL